MVGGKLRISEVAGCRSTRAPRCSCAGCPRRSTWSTTLGRSDELVSPRTTAASVWARGALRPMPAGHGHGSAERPGGRCAGCCPRPRWPGSRWTGCCPARPRGDDVSVGAWVGRRVGRAVVERLVDPLLGGVYAGRADELSLAATIPQLPRDERSVLAAARRVVPSPGVDRPGLRDRHRRDGFAAGLASRARSARGVARSLTGRAVRRLERTPTRLAGRARRHHGRAGDRGRRRRRRGAGRAGCPAARRRRARGRVPGSRDRCGEHGDRHDCLAAGRRTGARHQWLSRAGGLRPAGQGGDLRLGEVGAPRRTATPSSCGARSAGTATCPTFSATTPSWSTLRPAELTAYAGFSGAPIDARVSRWGGGLPQYAVGHRDRVARIRAAVAEVPGLAVCGATYDGVGVPACIRTGRAAAEAVLAESHEPRTAVIPPRVGT